MADTPAGQAERPATGVTAGLLAWLDSVDWVKRDRAYRARVTLSENDYATICVMTGGVADELLAAIPKYFHAFASMGADEAGAVAGLGRLLGDEGRQDVWNLVDKVFACCLVSWSMPDLYETYRTDRTHEPPNARMEPGQRMQAIRTLPLTVILRILLGVVWLSKNL